jgi:hypothetical protein
VVNRFSDALPVLLATHAAQRVLSCSPDDLVGRSFYEFIDERYLSRAINAIEWTKGNDSIVYLKLLWRRTPELLEDGNSEMGDNEESQLRRVKSQDSQYSQTRDNSIEVECLVFPSSDSLIIIICPSSSVDFEDE